MAGAPVWWGSRGVCRLLALCSLGLQGEPEATGSGGAVLTPGDRGEQGTSHVWVLTGLCLSPQRHWGLRCAGPQATGRRQFVQNKMVRNKRFRDVPDLDRQLVCLQKFVPRVQGSFRLCNWRRLSFLPSAVSSAHGNDLGEMAQ